MTTKVETPTADFLCSYAYSLLKRSQDETGEFGVISQKEIKEEDKRRHGNVKDISSLHSIIENLPSLQQQQIREKLRKPNCSISLIAVEGINHYRGMIDLMIQKAIEWFTGSNNVSSGWFRRGVYFVDDQTYGGHVRVTMVPDIRHTATALLAALKYGGPIAFIVSALENLLSDRCRDRYGRGWKVNPDDLSGDSDFYATMYVIACLDYLSSEKVLDRYSISISGFDIDRLINEGLTDICSSPPSKIGYSDDLGQTLRANGALLFFLAPLLARMRPQYLESSLQHIYENSEVNDDEASWLGNDLAATVDICAGLVAANPMDERYVTLINKSKRFISRRFLKGSFKHPATLGFILYIYGQSSSQLPAVPESSKKHMIPFQLHVSEIPKQNLEVRVLESPMGQSRSVIEIPYEPPELTALLKALSPSTELRDFSKVQLESLERLGFVDGGLFIPDWRKKLGHQLFTTLMSGEVEAAFHMALNQGRVMNQTVLLELRFDEDAVELSRYPWELLHDGRRYLLPSQAVTLTRYIAYSEAPTPIETTTPLNLLYIRPRPPELTVLPTEDEHEQMRKVLMPLEKSGRLTVIEPAQPTYDGLLDQLEKNEIQILHFDGHGVFARHCPYCNSMNWPHLEACANCQKDITQVVARGHLAFEDREPDFQTHWVGSDVLQHIFYNTSLQLAVLSACSSATVRGELFSGLGPALVQAGIPAVVANQLPITTNSEISFIRSFYQALTQFNPIAQAVNLGRRRLFRNNEWFIPVLYLRSQDHQGKLFVRIERS